MPCTMAGKANNCGLACLLASSTRCCAANGRVSTHTEALACAGNKSSSCCTRSLPSNTATPHASLSSTPGAPARSQLLPCCIRTVPLAGGGGDEAQPSSTARWLPSNRMDDWRWASASQITCTGDAWARRATERHPTSCPAWLLCAQLPPAVITGEAITVMSPLAPSGAAATRPSRSRRSPAAACRLAAQHSVQRTSAPAMQAVCRGGHSAVARGAHARSATVAAAAGRPDAASQAAGKVIHLVRHGETEMNVALGLLPPGARYGEPAFEDPNLPDTRLTRRGRSQAAAARAAAARLAPAPEVVVVSPLTRALQTADIVFDGHRCVCWSCRQAACARQHHSNAVAASPSPCCRPCHARLFAARPAWRTTGRRSGFTSAAMWGGPGRPWRQTGRVAASGCCPAAAAPPGGTPRALRRRRRQATAGGKARRQRRPAGRKS